MISQFPEWGLFRCDDPKCIGYGHSFGDRGYGYPVCPSTVTKPEGAGK